MAPDPTAIGQPRPATSKRLSERRSFYLWTAVLLAVSVPRRPRLARPRRHDRPHRPAAGGRLNHATVVINSAILVFREGLETILVLAAVTASFLGANRVYRRPVAAGAASALPDRHVVRRRVVHRPVPRRRVRRPGRHGLPSLIVLLIVMNWFFHKVYWTGWISNHHSAGAAASSDPDTNQTADAARPGPPRLHLGLPRGLRGRDLPAEPARALRLERRARGRGHRRPLHRGRRRAHLLAAPAPALPAPADHHRRDAALRPARSVGEEVNEMQLAGWIGTTQISGFTSPAGWAPGSRCSTTGRPSLGQFIALALVLGSYVAAQYLRVRRPRKRGLAAAQRATALPSVPADSPSGGDIPAGDQLAGFLSPEPPPATDPAGTPASCSAIPPEVLRAATGPPCLQQSSATPPCSRARQPAARRAQQQVVQRVALIARSATASTSSSTAASLLRPSSAS